MNKATSLFSNPLLHAEAGRFAAASFRGRCFTFWRRLGDKHQTQPLPPAWRPLPVAWRPQQNPGNRRKAEGGRLFTRVPTGTATPQVPEQGGLFQPKRNRRPHTAGPAANGAGGWRPRQIRRQRGAGPPAPWATSPGRPVPAGRGEEPGGRAQAVCKHGAARRASEVSDLGCLPEPHRQTVSHNTNRPSPSSAPCSRFTSETGSRAGHSP